MGVIIGLACVTITIVLTRIVQAIMRPSKLPGPWLLKYTNVHGWVVDAFLVLSKGDRLAKSLRQKYGPVVQISRNRVLVDNSEGIRDVYAVSHRLNRPAPLVMFHNYGTENLVSIEDGLIHHDRRKPIRSIYSVSAVNNEGTQRAIREAMRHFVGHLHSSEEPIDVRTPVRLVLHEIMSAIVYGSEHGLKLFDDKQLRDRFEKDVQYQNDRLFSISGAVMGFFPRFVLWLRQRKLAPALMSGEFPPGLVTDLIGRKALAALEVPLRRRSVQAERKDRSTPLIELMHNHYSAHGPDQSIPSTNYILSDCADHFWAGVTTSTDTLVPLIHHLSRPENRPRQHRLRRELREAGVKHGSPLPPTEVLAQLPYLDSVIRETLRLNPAIPAALDRKITSREGSISVCGHRIPADMTIGASPYLVGRNTDVFEHPEKWIPERWLLEEVESDTENRKERLKAMKRHLFAFGAGNRMCLGLNVAWATMRAAVAGLYSNFETEVAEVGQQGWLWDSREDRVKLTAAVWQRRLLRGRRTSHYLLSNSPPS